MPNKKQSSLSPRRRIGILTTLVILAWGAAAFSFVDRHWFSEPGPAESAISPENARLDVNQWQPGVKDQNQYYMNVYIVNNGKSTVFVWGHLGMGVLTFSALDKDMIDAYFIILKTKFRTANMGPVEIYPGPQPQQRFFSIPDSSTIQLDDAGVAALKAGTRFMYFFNMLKYRDQIIPPSKFIYGEQCVYIYKEALHGCEVGHNRTYISD